MSSTDLATNEGVLSYLSDTPFASHSVNPLTGGFGNYTYRIHLHTAYAGQSTAVLKHGKPYVPGMQALPFSLSRQKYEVMALRQMKQLLSSNPFVSVPDVYLLDEEASVIIMSDCGEGMPTLKAYIQNEPRAQETADLIGRELGSSLARLHTRGSSDPAFFEPFRANKEARELSAWATYGRLVSTLMSEPPPKLCDPAMEISKSQMEVASKISSEVTEAVLSTEETVVMGDFWPGNVLVRFQRNDDGDPIIERLFIIDWEMTKPGLAGLDIGQFCAELLLLQRFDQGAAAASGVTSGFLAAYREERGADLHIARTALVHMGVHLVVWTPRNSSWESKERTREVVMEGLKYLESNRDDPAFVQQSVFKALCSMHT